MTVQYMTFLLMAHRKRNTWNGDGGGGGGGEGVVVNTFTYFFVKNGFLRNSLLYGNTKICCYN